MSVPTAKQILNATEVYMKLGKNGDYGHQILNRSDLLSLSAISVTPYIGVSDANAIPNNSQIQRRYSMKKGATLFAAFSSSNYSYYTLYNANWDSSVLNDLETNLLLYDANFSGFAAAGNYYMTSANDWCYVSSNGVITSIGSFSPIYPTSNWSYAEYFGDYTIDPYDAWNGSSQDPDNKDYLYYYEPNLKWYNTWTYQSPSSSNYAQGIYLHYYNEAKVLYRRFNVGVEQHDSNRYAYIIHPSMTLTGGTSTDSTAKTLIYTINTNAGVAWSASIISGSSYASVTSGSSGVGTGSAQSIAVTITANSASARSFTLQIVDSINGSNTMVKSISCTQSSPNISFYMVYFNPEKPVVKPTDLPRLGSPNNILLYTDSSKSSYFTTSVEYVFKIYRNSNVIDTITIPAGNYQYNGNLQNSSSDSTTTTTGRDATSITKYSGTGNLSGYEILDF